MTKWISAFLVAVAALTASGPAAAQAVANAAATEAQYQDFGAWLEQVNDAMRLGNEAPQVISPLLQTIRSPAGAKAAAPRLRAAISEARRKVVQADAQLAATKPLDVATPGGLTPERIVSDAREQIRSVLALLADFDAVAAAMERDDRAAASRLADKMMSSAYVMVEANRLMVRNRQILMPAEDSNHQALGILVQIYQASGVWRQAWLSSRAGPNEPAAAALRADLADISREVRGLAAAGRRNLARERQEAAVSGAPPAEAVAWQSALESQERLFAIGDELVSICQTDVTAAELAHQPQHAMIRRLKPLEARYQEIVAAQSEIDAASFR